MVTEYVSHPTQTLQLTGLSKGTSYTVTVAVNNTAGFSPESDSVTASTAADRKYSSLSRTCTKECVP